MKRKTPEDQNRHALRDWLIVRYQESGLDQKSMAMEIPCSSSTLSAWLQRQKEIKGFAVAAVQAYKQRVQAKEA